jgi:hypothetical protein
MTTITMNNSSIKHDWSIENDTVAFTATLHGKSGDVTLRTLTTRRDPVDLADDFISSLKTFVGPDVIDAMRSLLRKRE